MALKYYFEFYDIVNILHRCEIYNDNYTDDPIEIKGNLSLSKAETEDTLEAIRGTALSINLEANVDLTFDDIYTSDERIYSIKYIRDSSLMYYGWISPSNIFESYVDSNWVISLDCIDGLGYLENLSYVDNSGFPFSGKQTGLEIIVNCLKRTGLSQNINTSIGIHYEGLSTSLNVLDNVYFNANRFIKDDESTYMDCNEVLRSILEIFSACITQRDGEWFIYKPNEFVGSTSSDFFSYDSDGVYIDDVSIDLTETIGSQMDGFYPHYVNENQQVSTEKPVGAFKVNYKYGLVRSFLGGTDLYSPDGVTIDYWDILSSTNMHALVAGQGGVTFDNITSAEVSNLRNTEVLVSSENPVNVYIEYTPPRSIRGTHYFNYKIILSDKVITDITAVKYYLKDDLSWGDADVPNTLQNAISPSTSGSGVLNQPVIDITTPEFPASLGSEAYFYIVIDTPFINPVASGDTTLNYVDIKPSISDSSLKGENHTFQVIANPSTKIEPTKEVYNGDSATDDYVGTIYKNDEDTSTEFWFRKVDETRLVPLLQLMGEDRMKMYNKPLRVFSGDLYGYVEYMSLVSLDGFDGVEFMCIEYEYNANDNITVVKLKQVLNNDIGDSDFSGLDYALSYDYGTVVSPTIKG